MCFLANAALSIDIENVVKTDISFLLELLRFL